MKVINLTKAKIDIQIEQQQNELLVIASHGQHSHSIAFWQFKPFVIGSVPIGLSSEQKIIGFPTHKICQLTFSPEINAYFAFTNNSLSLLGATTSPVSKPTGKVRDLLKALGLNLFSDVLLNFFEDNTLIFSYAFEKTGQKFDIYPICLCSKATGSFYHYHSSKATFDEIMGHILKDLSDCRLAATHPENYLVFSKTGTSGLSAPERLQTTAWTLNYEGLKNYCSKHNLDFEQMLLFRYNLYLG